MDRLEPSNPYHIAQAYRVRPTSPIAPTMPVVGARGSDEARAARSDASASGASQSPAREARLSRLIARVVPGGVGFEGDSARPSGLSLYSSAGERNIAATGVELGRRVDVRG